MATTFTKILLHCIFSTKNRDSLITPQLETDLYPYMVGIARNMECPVLQINGIADHLHLLVAMSKHVTVIDLMANVKKDSSKWINETGRIPAKFSWQDGYAAFSIGESGVNGVCRYIQRQKEHHHRMTFKEELIRFLKKYKVEYDERYIWT